MSSYVNATEIPDNEEFSNQRQMWREALASDSELRSKAVELQIAAEEHRYTYHHEWLGVPIIRLPDDIVLQQEIVHHLRPSAIIETGVARGGSLVLSASLMDMNSLTPSVLGLDLLILPHAKSLIEQSRYANAIQLWEGDSSFANAQQVVTGFIQQISNPGPILLVLDSDHSENHVLAELRNFADLLPVGSIIMVADTIIEEFPKDYYMERPWNVGNNPCTAVREFLKADNRFNRATKWDRRSLLSEFREGIIVKMEI